MRKPLTSEQRWALNWIATKRCNSSTWLGISGEDGFQLSGPDGTLTISLEDQIALRPYFKPNPKLFDGERDRLWALTPAGRAALSQPTPTTEDKGREDRA